MEKSFSAVVYERHGNPAEVLRVEERPWPQAGAEEAVVQMRAAPINPADINMIEGKYPVRLPLPATPGMEGAGTVMEIGASVQNVRAGDLVILPHNLGTWRGALAIPAAALIVVPTEIDPIQAAMLKINPLTAWRLLHGFVTLQAGDWVIQNAANSAAGRPSARDEQNRSCDQGATEKRHPYRSRRPPCIPSEVEGRPARDRPSTPLGIHGLGFFDHGSS